MLAQEPIEIDQNIHFLSDKSKHMAFKHSDWLETKYYMKIQNLLFTLVSQEPLWYYESCFQESSSKNIPREYFRNISEMNGPQRTACLAKGYGNRTENMTTTSLSHRTCEREHNSGTIQAQFRWNSANDVMQILRLASSFARQWIHARRDVI